MGAIKFTKFTKYGAKPIQHLQKVHKVGTKRKRAKKKRGISVFFPIIVLLIFFFPL